MSKEKSSLADLLRNHINSKLQKNFDYSLASNRKQDILDFIEANKLTLNKEQLNIKTIRPSHNTALDECLKNKGIDPQSIGRKTKKPKFQGDLSATITPEPQAGTVDQTQKQKPTGAPIQAGVEQPQQAQAIIFDEKAVSATLNAFFLMFKMGYPDLELLTNDEKESLGKVWLPAFNKYMTENWAMLGIPFLATMGIFIPKIVEARKKKKIRESKEEGLEKQKETDSKLEQREKSIKTTIEPEKPVTPQIGILKTKIESEEKKTGL